MTENVLIIGCGNTGKRVATLARAQGKNVYALSRSSTSTATLESIGIRPVNGDLDDQTTLDFSRITQPVIYFFAPPQPTGILDLRVRNFVARLNTNGAPKKLVYISTTGVYGDHNGAWITEETPTNPGNDRSRRRLDAENWLRIWAESNGVPTVILRVAGIYGPGRWPLERLQQQLPVITPAEAPPSNRIHVDDLAMICVRAMRDAAAGEIFNVADGNPTTMTDYFISVARAFQLPEPPQISFAQAQRELTPAMLSFINENKKICNKKLLSTLNITLAYPSIREGIKEGLPH